MHPSDIAFRERGIQGVPPAVGAGLGRRRHGGIGRSGRRRPRGRRRGHGGRLAATARGRCAVAAARRTGDVCRPAPRGRHVRAGVDAADERPDGVAPVWSSSTCRRGRRCSSAAGRASSPPTRSRSRSAQGFASWPTRARPTRSSCAASARTSCCRVARAWPQPCATPCPAASTESSTRHCSGAGSSARSATEERSLFVRTWDGEDVEDGVTIHPVWVGDVLDRTDWLRDLSGLAEQGVLPLRVAATFPPERAADAHRQMEAGGLRGRASRRLRLSCSKGLEPLTPVPPCLPVLPLDA